MSACADGPAESLQSAQADISLSRAAEFILTVSAGKLKHPGVSASQQEIAMTTLYLCLMKHRDLALNVRRFKSHRLLLGSAACLLAILLLPGCDNNPFPSGETA